jgi:hypothetical protein
MTNTTQKQEQRNDQLLFAWRELRTQCLSPMVEDTVPVTNGLKQARGTTTDWEVDKSGSTKRHRLKQNQSNMMQFVVN